MHCTILDEAPSCTIWPYLLQDPSQPTVRALIGSSSDEDTIALSRVSQADKMPIMGYKVETADLSDKVTAQLLTCV